MSPSQATVNHRVDSVSIYIEGRKFLNQGFSLRTSCRQLDWQLSFVTQIFSQLSPLLSSVRSLRIHSGNELPTGEEEVDSTQWLELFRPFTQVTKVYVRRRLVPGIVQALAEEDMPAEVLPKLTLLQLGDRGSKSMVEVANKFIARRTLSGHAISVTFGNGVCRFLIILLIYTYQVQVRQLRLPLPVTSVTSLLPRTVPLDPGDREQHYREWEEEQELEWHKRPWECPTAPQLFSRYRRVQQLE